MSLSFENAFQRERERQHRQREGGQHTELSERMGTLSPAGVGRTTAASRPGHQYYDRHGHGTDATRRSSPIGPQD